VKNLVATGELVAPFKSSADPARAYFAVVSKSAGGRPEVSEFVDWLKQEAGKK
jgi:DNA-binding transcriptional LysR family regulator